MINLPLYCVTGERLDIANEGRAVALIVEVVDQQTQRSPRIKQSSSRLRPPSEATDGRSRDSNPSLGASIPCASRNVHGMRRLHVCTLDLDNSYTRTHVCCAVWDTTAIKRCDIVLRIERCEIAVVALRLRWLSDSNDYKTLILRLKGFYTPHDHRTISLYIFLAHSS